MKKTRFLLLLPLFFLFFSISFLEVSAGAGIIAGPTGVNSSSNTCVMTTAANTNIITGDLLVVVSSISDSGATVSSISDSAGLFTLTKIVSSSVHNNITMFSSLSTGSASTDTVTITYSGNVLNRCEGYFVRGVLSSTPNQTSTGSGTSASNTITASVSSFTPTSNNYVIAAGLVVRTSGAESAANQAPSSPFSAITGIQGGAGTNYHSSIWQSPRWISGATTANNVFTITGATALEFDAVAASFFTGPETTTTSLTATTTTTTAFSTTLTNTETVTSTSFSPTVTSTSFSPTVTLTNTVTNTETSTSIVTSTSFSPTVTSTSFSPTVTSTSILVTTTTNIFNTTTTFDVFNQTSTVSITQTQVTIPEPEGSTDILLIFLAIGIALIMFVVGIRYRKAFVTLMGATVLMLLETGLITNPLIVYGSNQFPMPLWLLEVIGLFVVIGFMFVLYQVLRSRRF